MTEADETKGFKRRQRSKEPCVARPCVALSGLADAAMPVTRHVSRRSSRLKPWRSRMPKRLSPVALNALRDALCAIYWYKADLRSFLQNSLSDQSVLARADWNAYKRQIVTDVIDALCADQERYSGALLPLCDEVCKRTARAPP